jgi:predicted nucleic acid-binding protein
MLLDSNVIIYSAQPENEFLRQLIAERVPAVSAVSYVEVLGYHHLTEVERRYFAAFFAEARVLPLSQPVLEEAVRLRQAKKIKLGDSLVAGTASYTA